MKRLTVVTALLLASGCNNHLSIDFEETRTSSDEVKGAEDGPWVVRAHFSDELAMNALTAEYAPWEVHRDKGFVIIEVASRQDYEQLESLGYTLEVDETNTLLLNALPPDVGALAGIPGYSCYRTVEETYNTASQLAANNPTLATWTDIGDSWEKTDSGGGYDINVLRLTNQAIAGPKPVFFAMSAIHAREYTTAELATRFAEHLLANYGTDADVTWLLDHHEIHLVLQSNPDGRKYAEGGSLWRKNTDENYCGATSSSRGADLNRNYPFGWGGSGSSGSQCSSTYRGPTAASEPETQAITAYVRSIFPDQRDESLGKNEPAPADATGVFMDIHSYSELVLWPWGDTSGLAPNGAALRTLGRRFAHFNDYTPQQSIDLYATDGTTLDFAYGELGVASYTFELGTSFFQGCSTFENTVFPDNLEALLYAAKVARTPYLTPSGPDSLNVTLDSSSVPQGTPVQITATADDTRVNNSNGTEPTQNISAAEVWIDTPPWEFGLAAASMSAQDGSFNEKVEGVTASLDTSSLSEGRHILFVRSQDASGSFGPVSAAFLDILPSSGNQAPSATITGPADGTTVTEGASVALTGTASDPEDGDLTAGLSWSSNLDGSLGTGGSVNATLSVGSHTITASATDSGGLGASDSISVTVSPAGGGGDLLDEDFDSGAAGWTTDGLWHVAGNSSCTSPDAGSTSAPNAMYYGQDSTCTYATGSVTRGNLTSPTISGVSASSVLRFNYWRQVESYSGNYDVTSVEILVGGSPTTVWSRNSSNASSSDWLASGDISLSGFAGQSIQVRFRFDSRDNYSNGFTGWLIDDVVVTAD